MRAALAALLLIAAPAAAQEAQMPGAVEAVVYFEWDDARAPVEFARALDEVADKLKVRPWRSVWLEGHTDGPDTPGYALERGMRWTSSIQQELVGRGIDPSRIRSISYGNTRPAVASETRELMNRRVEIRVEWE